MLHTILMILHFFCAAGIVALVLLQRGKGAEAGAGFGAGASGTVFGARGASTALSRATAILFAIFMVTSLTLAYVGTRKVTAPSNSLLDQLTQQPAQQQPAQQPPAPQPYRRSPFQVALLLFATGGVYLFWWAFWARRWCSATLEREDQPLWKSIALIVPIFNLFLMYDLGQKIKGTAWRAGLRQGSMALGLVGIASFFISATWRLPSPMWLFSTLEFVPLAWLHYVLVRSALVLQGAAAAPTRFHWLEWIVIVAGCTLWGINFAAPLLPGAAADDLIAPWFRAVVLAADVIALTLFWRASRRLSAPPSAAATVP